MRFRTNTYYVHRTIGWILLALASSGCGYDNGRLDAGGGISPESGSMNRDDGAAGNDTGNGQYACSNGVDDDCDGLVDYAGGDPGCTSASDNDERGPGHACDDGLDNDDDELRDYTAPGCGVAGDPGCSSPTDQTEVDIPTPP